MVLFQEAPNRNVHWMHSVPPHYRPADIREAVVPVSHPQSPNPISPKPTAQNINMTPQGATTKSGSSPRKNRAQIVKIKPAASPPSPAKPTPGTLTGGLYTENFKEEDIFVPSETPMGTFLSVANHAQIRLAEASVNVKSIPDPVYVEECMAVLKDLGKAFKPWSSLMLRIHKDLSRAIFSHQSYRGGMISYFSLDEARAAEIQNLMEKNSSLSTLLQKTASSENKLAKQNNELQTRVRYLENLNSSLEGQLESVRQDNKNIRVELMELEKVHEGQTADLERLQRTFHSREVELNHDVYQASRQAAKSKEDLEKALHELGETRRELMQRQSVVDTQKDKETIKVCKAKIAKMRARLTMLNLSGTLRVNLQSVRGKGPASPPPSSIQGGGGPGDDGKEELSDDDIPHLEASMSPTRKLSIRNIVHRKSFYKRAEALEESSAIIEQGLRRRSSFRAAEYNIDNFLGASRMDLK